MLSFPGAFLWNDTFAQFALASLTWRLITATKVTADLTFPTRQTRLVCA